MRPDLNHFSKPPRPPVVGDMGRQLRALPAEAPPPYDFAEFQRRSVERASPKRQWITWPHAVAAAGLAAFVAAMAVMGTGAGSRDAANDGGAQRGAVVAVAAPGTRSGRDETNDDDLVPPASDEKGEAPAGAAVASTGMPPRELSAATGDAPRVAAVDPRAVPTPGEAANDDPALSAREAREWLAHQPAEPAVVRTGSRLVVMKLEDRIAWFDDALTDERLHDARPAQLKLLQQERARLVSSLAQVRYAEALVAGGS